MSEEKSKALQLINHTRDLYAAILRARSETSGLVLKDMGDAIYDAIPWDDLSTPVKQALVIITRELMHANTEKAIRDIEGDEKAEGQADESDGQTSLDYSKETRSAGGAFVRFGSDEIENEESEENDIDGKEAEAETVIEPTEENTRPSL